MLQDNEYRYQIRPLYLKDLVAEMVEEGRDSYHFKLVGNLGSFKVSIVKYNDPDVIYFERDVDAGPDVWRRLPPPEDR